MKNRRTIIFFSAFLLAGIIQGQTSYDLLLKANALAGSGKPDKVVELLSSAPGILNNSRLLNARADAKIQVGDYTGAISDCNLANDVTQYSGEYGLSRIYASKGDVLTSLYHLEISMRSSFRKNEKEIMLDPVFARIENTPEWRQFWKKEWYSIRERKVSEAEYYIKSGNIEEARTLLLDMESNYPGYDETIYAGALVNMGSGSFGESVKALSSLLTRDPENKNYLRALASAQSSMANPAGASSTFTKLISLEAEDPELFMLRAECYRKTGEWDKAMADIMRYLEIFPGSRNALSLAGKTEFSAGNNIKALEFYSENLRLHPDDPQCYVDRGNSYFISRSWQWAIYDFSMALDLSPENSDAWLTKGIALVNSGKTEDACHDFRQAFRLGNKSAVEYISKYCIK
jgi:tetratricopeptide (TPR) repeat protein